MQFQVSVNDFLRFCAIERRLSQHTVDAYEADLRDFTRWVPSVATVDAVTEVELKSYLASMVDVRTLAPATVRRRVACLRSFFRFQAVNGCPDPFSTWRPALPPRRKRLPRSLSRTEAASLVSARVARQTERSSLSVVILLMLATGIRVGELCRLRVDDVAPDGSTVRIHGKGSRDRVAYVSDPDLRRELERLIRARQSELGTSDALFKNPRGGDFRPSAIRSKLRRHAAAAGVSRRVTPHMLRHTAATLLIESGVDIRFVQRLLGHSSIATTEIYTHVSDESLRSTLAKADILRALVL